MNWLLKITGLSKLWGALIALGGFLATIALIWRKGRSDGVKTERAKQTKRTVENVQKAKLATDKLAADPDERKRLRKRRQRPY